MDQAQQSPQVAPPAQERNSTGSARGSASLDPMSRAQRAGGGGNAWAQARLEGLACGDESSPGGGTAWDVFAREFNAEFCSILHVFGGSTGGESRIAPGAASGDGLTAERLQALFTEGQRCKLSAFFHSNLIPDRLFDGDEVGQASAQQRILMSAHILEVGEYAPGSFVQRVHARMCFHWAQIVHHYAGVTPSSGGLAEGMMGEFDHAGNVVLGAGTTDGDAAFHGARVDGDDLHGQDTAGTPGAIPADSAHGRTAARDAERRAGDPEARSGVFRQCGMPWDQVSALLPGDWVWFYNANGSASGAHSVIFSRWSGPERATENGTHYRRAVCFSQGSPERGGQEHESLLGDAFADTAEGQVHPITHLTRMATDAHPATTPEELLPPSRHEAQLQAQNRLFLAGVQRRLHHPVDLARLEEWLRARNTELIAQISASEAHRPSRTTEGQRRLLEETNQRDDVEMLVRLNERLRALVASASTLRENEQAQYEGHLNGEYAEESAQVAEREAELDHERMDIDAEASPLRAELASVVERLSAFDTRAERRAHADEIRQLRERKRELERQIRPLDRRLARVERERSQAEGELPFGLVHPGGLGDPPAGRTTGRLADVPGIPWETLLAEGSAA